MVVMGGDADKGGSGEGRKDEDWGKGGGAEASRPKGLLVPGGACCFGAVSALQRYSR